MSIKQNPKNPKQWIARFQKRHPISRKAVGILRIYKSKIEAEKNFPKLVIEWSRKVQAQTQPFWCALIQEFIEARRIENYSEKCLYDYEVCLRAHTSHWDGKQVSEIRPEMIHEVIKQRLLGRSDATKRNILKMIRAILSFAVGKGYVPVNVTPSMKIKITNKEKLVLTRSQVMLLLSKGEEFNWEWLPHVSLALYSGLRNGELYALRWENVDVERGYIFVRESWNNKSGFKCTKSGDERKVPIVDELRLFLDRLRIKTGGTGFVLPRLKDWDRGEQARKLRTFLLGLGLPQIRFHDLRASFATLLLEAGEPPAKVMLVGGWKDMKTMMIYMRKAGIGLEGFGKGLNLISPEPSQVLSFSRSVVSGSKKL